MGRDLIRMNYKYNVSYSKTVAQNWTQTAVDCYKLNCNCYKCNLYRIYFKNSSFSCQMRETVKELIRKQGIPKISESAGEEI